MLTGESQLPVVVNVSVNCCLFLCVSLVTVGQHIHGEPYPSLYSSSSSFQPRPPTSLNRIRGKEQIDGHSKQR